MRMWIDTEFDGYGGRLISLALVTENGDEFYVVYAGPTPKVKWVRDNVIPVLNSTYFMTQQEVADALAKWLAKYDSVHIIADWPDDIAYFCRAMITKPGEAISTPPLSFEIQPGLPSTADWSVVPHNALEDARVLANYGKRHG